MHSFLYGQPLGAELNSRHTPALFGFFGSDLAEGAPLSPSVSIGLFSLPTRGWLGIHLGHSLGPSRTREKYVWQNLCTILGLSDVAILDSGWPIKSLLVTFSDV